MKTGTVLILCLTSFLYGFSVYAATDGVVPWTDKKTPKKDASKPQIDGSATGTVEIAGVRADTIAKTVSCEGKICIKSGILEYLVVAKGGKDYESLIELNVKPSDLHAAFLLIGATVGPIPEEFAAEKKGDLPSVKKNKKSGSRFTISLELTGKDGKKIIVPAETLVYDRESDSEGKGFEWVFTGSYFFPDENGNERYIADSERSVAGIWYDGGALLNLARVSKNPYRGDDFGFELNEKTCPEKGTKLRVIFHLKP